MNEYFSLTEENGVALITLKRAGDPYNTLNRAFGKALKKTFEELDESPTVKVLIITGTGRVFCTGADILQEFSKLSAEEARRLSAEGSDTFTFIERMKIPVIAAINGFCLGGGLELALCCDYRIASNKAVLGQPEINLGLIPGWGGSQRLPRTIGRSQALRLILAGETIRAEEALKLGLVDEVIPHEKLMDRVRDFAYTTSKKSKAAIRLAKMAVNQGLHLPLWYGLVLENELFGRAWESEDRVEGVNAFIEKRKPRFKDR